MTELNTIEQNAKEARQEALAALATLGGRTTSDNDIKFEGKKFVVPATMKDLDEAIDYLDQIRTNEEASFSFSRTFRFRPYDGAVATGRAIRNAFGVAVGKPIITFFGSRPPELMDVEIDLDVYEQAPWGALEIPGLDGMTLYLGAQRDRELGHVFSINAEGPKKYRAHVSGLFDLIEDQLNRDSIYRGKAINGQSTPGFLDLSGVKPEKVIYTQEVMRQLEANVWSPIQHADQLDKLGQPGKRAVLFEGPYGTGKTLAAYLTAQKAVENGWTFIMVRPGRDNLQEVLQTARMYQPACVFFEDLDTVASPTHGGEDHMSKVLDLFDGLDTKGLKMLLVLTTNRVEKLHPGMLRPGRLDAVVSVGALDEDGITRLATQVLGDALDKNIDWGAVATAMDGYMPAFVKEALDRAIRYLVARGEMANGAINTVDLVAAAEGLRFQFNLQHGASEAPTGDQFTGQLGAIVQSAAQNAVRNARILDSDGDFFGIVEPEDNASVN